MKVLPSSFVKFSGLFFGSLPRATILCTQAPRFLLDGRGYRKPTGSAVAAAAAQAAKIGAPLVIPGFAIPLRELTETFSFEGFHR